MLYQNKKYMSAKGGITEGKSHKEGGIPMVVKSTGQQVELEGGEGVINKRNMASTKTFEFEGKEKTICEIASDINSADGNGVQIDCDNVTGTKYKYAKGGKILNEEEEESFKEWMEDGNVHKFEDGYSTQDAQWRNRLKGLDELRKYFKKEFLSDSYAKGGKVEKIKFEEFLDGKLSYPQVGYDENGDVLVDIIYRHYLLEKPFTHKNARLIDYAPNDKIKYPIQIKQTIYNKLIESKYAKGGWLLINADTERIIKEYDTESEARQMSYEYDGDSFVMEKSELEKEKSRETYRPPAPLNPATYIGMERGGSIDVETYDYNKLIGKYVYIYSMGVELPYEEKIEGVMFSSPQFRYRQLTLKFDRGIAPIEIEDILKFLNNDIVYVNDNKEDFGVQLIPNQFAKGGWIQRPIKIKKDVYQFEDQNGVGYIVKRGVGERITPMWIVSTDEEGTWDGSHEPFYTKKSAEEYIESFFAKGGKTENTMKFEDYESASMSMGGYEDGAISSNPTEFAKGGGVKKAQGVEWMKSDGQYEAELGFLYLIISPSTERGLYNVRVKEGYRGETIGVSTNDISGLDNAKDLAYDIAGDYYKQFADGGGISSIKVGDEVIWKGNKYLLTNITSDTRSGFYDKKYFLSSNQVGVSDAILDSLKDVKKYKYAKGGGVGNYEMYDEQLYLDNDLKDAILENDTLSTFIKERHFIRDKNGKLFMWIDWMDYDQFDKLANFLGYKYAQGGIVEYVDSKRTDKNYFFLRYEGAIGSFAWIYNGKYNEGILYPLDNFDKEYYAHIPLKSGEKLFRYATERMSSLDKYAIKPFNNVRYLIKFNLDKGLIYFMSEDNDPNDDKNIRFDTRGTKADYIVIDKERFEQGGDVRDMSWYQDFKKQELKRGTEHEMEHIDTIKKFKKEGVSDEEVAKAIAKDHLDENDNYYIELEKMEENAKQVNDTLTEHEKHKNRKKNIKRFRLGGYMGYRGEMIYIKMKEDVTTDLFNLEGRFYSETTFKKDALIMMSFISNNGYSTKMEIMDTGVYAIIPNVAFELVGYDSTKYGKGGDVKPQFSSVDLSENDKEILSVLRTMNEENTTHEQREFISNFRGKNVVNQLSKQVISKIYGLLFEWHNIENPIHNILIENVGAGNMASLLTNSLVKKIGIEFIKDNPYYLIEKKINSIVNSSMTFYDMSSYDLKSLDAIVKVYEKTNPLNDTLVQRLYQTDKKAVAVGVAEFTSETHLNEFKNSVGINMGGFAQNQMFLAKSMNYFVVNEGITDEGKHTLIYGVTKY